VRTASFAEPPLRGWGGPRPHCRAAQRWQEMAGLEDRLERLLARRRCVRALEAAALLRATPGEVAEAARRIGAELKDGGAVVCAPARPPPQWHPVAARGPRVEVLGSGCCGVAVEPPPGRGLPGLVRAARRAASLARRVAEEGCPRGCRYVAPVVLWSTWRGPVEGVLVVPPGGLGPWLCEEAERLYPCRRWGRA
jgi:hypothetical protein